MMRKHLILVLVLSLLLCVSTLFGGTAGAAESFIPEWNVGDHWTVQAVYRTSPEQDEWSQPVFWEYEIMDRIKKGDAEYLIMEIRDRDGLLNLSSRLLYRVENLSLASVEITKLRHGKESVRVLTREETAPAVTEQTLTPYDTPVFPLICPSSVDFTVTRHIDGLKALRTIRQEVRTSTVDELPGQVPGEGLLEVTCIGTQETVFTQWWGSSFPWPVYGKNTNMKYWLVRE
ncbi:MAG TPA: hypothetical protein PKZ42_05610 [Syntrophales bacterium]|nr:hypothetical protein [Syntrophales bacterium]